MQKTLIAMAVAVAGMATMTGASFAMTPVPAPSAGNTLVQDIRDGCPRGYQPNQWGRCKPIRYRDDGYNDGQQYAPRYRRNDYGDDGYGDQGYGNQGYGDDGYGGGYRARRIDRGNCPPGRHPGNSGRCVKDY